MFQELGGLPGVFLDGRGEGLSEGELEDGILSDLQSPCSECKQYKITQLGEVWGMVIS